MVQMSKGVVLFGTVIVILLAFFSYAGHTDRTGRASAEQLCASIHVGQDVASVRVKMMAAEREPRMTNFGSDTMSVMFWGAFGERYACNARLQDGKVTQTEINHLD